MKSNQPGIISIIVFLALAILLILASFFLSSTVLESELSQKEKQGLRAYYLAEAGIGEAIWKLKNDDIWKNNFIEDCGWESEVFIRENIFFPNSSYQVQVKNSDCAEGEITATSTLTFSSGEIIKKAVKAKVSKSLITLTSDSAIFPGGRAKILPFQLQK